VYNQIAMAVSGVMSGTSPISSLAHVLRTHDLAAYRSAVRSNGTQANASVIETSGFCESSKTPRTGDGIISRCEYSVKRAAIAADGAVAGVGAAAAADATAADAGVVPVGEADADDAAVGEADAAGDGDFCGIGAT
jgi:hypothetical protein